MLPEGKHRGPARKLTKVPYWQPSGVSITRVGGGCDLQEHGREWALFRKLDFIEEAASSGQGGLNEEHYHRHVKW